MSGAARRRHQYPERRTTKRTQKAKKPASSRCWTNPAFPVRHIARPMRTIYERHDYAGDHRSSPGAWSRRCCQRRQSDRLTHTASSATTSVVASAGTSALKSDPNHVLTWQCYRLWQIEQGNREQAQYHLTPDRADLRQTCDASSLAERLSCASAGHRTGLLAETLTEVRRLRPAHAAASARVYCAPSVSR